MWGKSYKADDGNGICKHLSIREFAEISLCYVIELGNGKMNTKTTMMAIKQEDIVQQTSIRGFSKSIFCEQRQSMGLQSQFSFD